MRTKLAHSIVPTMETCPNCKGRMTVTEVTPILFTDDLEDVTYRCKGCCSEMKRTFKRRSGAWQLIRYTPEFPHFNDIARFRKPVGHLRDHRFGHLRSGSTRDK
jgi:transposase-like protein